MRTIDVSPVSDTPHSINLLIHIRVVIPYKSIDREGTAVTTLVKSDQAAKRLTLASVCLAILILPASLTGTSIAQPHIAGQMATSVQALQWAVNSYNLTFACLMLAAGSLSDLWGRRRMFVGGSLLFIVGSILTAISTNIWALDAFRALSGVGAAVVMTSGSALLAANFQGVELGKAFALLGSAAGAGLAFGPSLAGLAITVAGWPAVFLLHAVVSAIALLLGVISIPADQTTTGAKVDVLGTVTFSVSVLAFVFAIVQSGAWGFLSPSTIGLLALSILLFALFVYVERKSENPMLDVSLLTNKRFVAISSVPVALTFGFVCLLVYLPTYLAGVQGRSAGQIGLIMILLTFPVLVVPAIVARLAAKGLGPRTILTASVATVMVGVLLLCILRPNISVLELAVPLLVIGIGMGISAGTVDGLAISVVPPERAGMAAGMFNTVRLTSEAVGVAAFGALIVGLTHYGFTNRVNEPNVDQLTNSISTGQLSAAEHSASWYEPLADSYTDSMRIALLIVAIFCAIVAALVYRMMTPQKVDETVEGPTHSADRVGEVSQ